jgi:hypothetical protein
LTHYASSPTRQGNAWSLSIPDRRLPRSSVRRHIATARRQDVDRARRVGAFPIQPKWFFEMPWERIVEPDLWSLPAGLRARHTALLGGGRPAAASRGSPQAAPAAVSAPGYVEGRVAGHALRCKP